MNFYMCKARIDSSVHHRNSIMAHMSTFESIGCIVSMGIVRLNVFPPDEINQKLPDNEWYTQETSQKDQSE